MASDGEFRASQLVMEWVCAALLVCFKAACPVGSRRIFTLWQESVVAGLQLVNHPTPVLVPCDFGDTLMQ